MLFLPEPDFFSVASFLSLLGLSLLFQGCSIHRLWVVELWHCIRTPGRTEPNEGMGGLSSGKVPSSSVVGMEHTQVTP